MQDLRSYFSTYLKPKNRRALPDDGMGAVKPDSYFTTGTAIFIAIVVGGSLWISVNGLIEKVHLSRELQQIVDIVAAAKDAALARRLDENNSEDLLAALGHFGSLTPTGEINGVKTLSNPWGGTVAASTIPGGRQFRLETVAPASKCRRLLDLFVQNQAVLGIQQITVKDREANWQPLYAENAVGQPAESQLTAICNNPVQADMIITFALK